MAKRQPQTIVKELRTLTQVWTPGKDVPSYRWEQVAMLIDELPSFRSAPQTKTENTLRSIEALLRATIKQDPTKDTLNDNTGLMQDPASYHVNPMLLIGAIYRIINTHHGVKPDPYKPLLKPYSMGTLVYDAETKPKPPFGCTGYYDFVDAEWKLVHEAEGCSLHDPPPAPKKKASLITMTVDEDVAILKGDK